MLYEPPDTGAGMTFLTEEHLNKLPTRRLLQIHHAARATESCIWNHAGWRCCEICKEFVGTEEEWQEEVVKPAKEWEAYKKTIKAILATRPHVSTKKRPASKPNRKPRTRKR